MKICFLGDSHAPRILREAARKKGFEIVKPSNNPELVFISQDVETDEKGKRYLSYIEEIARDANAFSGSILILTSQVTPGFTRSLGFPIYHLIETLRIIDAQERADNPEMHVIGCDDPAKPLPAALQTYLDAWPCPKFRVTYEEAEFTKIAINTFLAAQVDTTNRLAAAANRIGADWEKIAQCLRWDKRIGHYAYLKPGRWQDSKHLLRDAYTLERL